MEFPHFQWNGNRALLERNMAELGLHYKKHGELDNSQCRQLNSHSQLTCSLPP